MEVNYKIINVKDFIKAKPTGEMDLEQSQEALTQIALMASPPSNYEILIDAREAYAHMNYADIYSLIAILGKHRSAFRNKIALLVRDDEQFDNARFMELSSRYRGFKVRAFTSFEETINWLQSSCNSENNAQ